MNPSKPSFDMTMLLCFVGRRAQPSLKVSRVNAKHRALTRISARLNVHLLWVAAHAVAHFSALGLDEVPVVGLLSLLVRPAGGVQPFIVPVSVLPEDLGIHLKITQQGNTNRSSVVSSPRFPDISAQLFG